MILELEATNVEIKPDYQKKLRVTLDDVSMGNVVEQCGQSGILDHIGIYEVMQHYTNKEIIKEIGEDEALSVIKITDAINYYEIDNLLDEIGMAEAKAKWGLVEPE